MNEAIRPKNVVGEVYFRYSTDEEVLAKYDNQHCHDSYEILYIINGSGKYVIEGAEFPIKPRMVLFAAPFSYHSLKLDPGVKYERYVLQFFPSDLTPSSQDFLTSLTKSIEGLCGYYDANAISPSIFSIFDRFLDSEAMPEKERKEFRKLLTSELVLLLSVATRENVTRDERDLGARVIRYLNNEITKDVSLDKLAKRFFVSKYYLCRAFKKHNGISIHGYVNQKRVMYAKQLIESGESASSAAYRVGFGDYSAFYRAYMKIIGCAPTSHAEPEEEKI